MTMSAADSGETTHPNPPAVPPQAVLPTVSVIVVVRNEAGHIRECLERILSQDYPPDRMEVLVVDGMSDDGTREIVKALDGGPASLRVLPNPRLGRAQGLNVGVQAARGEIIARIDARTVVGKEYLRHCVTALQQSGADNVGGVQRALSSIPMQEAIGSAMAHPFGVGDAQFRLGRRSGFVDTVYPGCFRREVFDRVGLFDEDAPVISEDSDLNFRLRRAGGRVYLDTGIVVHYTPRETLADLWHLYFRYGGARAGNVIKHRTLSSWRPLAPVALVTALVGLSIASVGDRGALSWLVGVAGAYLITDTAVSAALAWPSRSLPLFARLLIVFPCMHLAYGLGFWRRLLQRPPPEAHWGY